jgi:serine/threonine-protein kinase
MYGVAAAHRVGVVHRDIHPGNIFLAREAPSALLVPKVLDFGISKIRDDHQRGLTGSGVAMGTPLYMSYEQLCSARDIDARTDVYSFGVMLYQGLTGQLPFEANVLTELLIRLATTSAVSPKQLVPELPATLDRLILWALERERDSRIQSMQAFIDELEPFASERAFRTQMTDAQRTLPSIVPRASSEPPPFAQGVGRASKDPAPAPVPEPPAVRSTDPANDASAAAEEGDIAASMPPTPSRSRWLPTVFVAAAALVLLGAGTHLMRRSSPAAEHVRRVAAPRPLPLLDAGLLAPAAPSRRERDRTTRERTTGPSTSAEVLADAATASVLVNPAASGHDQDAATPSFSPEVPLPKPPVARLKPQPKNPAPSRRFRAGKPRLIDFRAAPVRSDRVPRP